MTSALRRAARKDDNHARLRLLWRHMGFSWLDLSVTEPGQPDALLGAWDVDQLAEVKAPGEDPRRDQVLWHRRWRGRPVVVLREAKDLERLARVMRDERS